MHEYIFGDDFRSNHVLQQTCRKLLSAWNQMASKTGLTFISAWFCPYAQRAWLALEISKVKYNWVEGLKIAQDTISYIKDPLLLKHNPNALVPTIVDAEEKNVVYDSLRCVEFISEYGAQTTGAPPLLPTDPFQRAKCRERSVWVDNSICSPFYKVLILKSATEQKQAFDRILKGLVAFGEELKGPYYFGEDISMVDIALIPWAYRWFILEKYRGEEFRIPSVQEDVRLKPYLEWQERVFAREDVKRTLQDKDRLVAVYRRYADGDAKTKVCDAVKAGKEAHEHD